MLTAKKHTDRKTNKINITIFVFSLVSCSIRCFLHCSVPDKTKKAKFQETAYTRFHHFNFWLHHVSVLHLAAFAIGQHY